MGFIDYLLLFITVLLIAEAVNEARRKNWLALAISLAFLALVIYMTTPIYQALWTKIAPAPKAPATP
jgi:hypothetical protein